MVGPTHKYCASTETLVPFFRSWLVRRSDYRVSCTNQSLTQNLFGKEIKSKSNHGSVYPRATVTVALVIIGLHRLLKFRYILHPDLRHPQAPQQSLVLGFVPAPFQRI